ncbi:MAG TPA: Fur family transcriptional regulator [Bacillota bacterium]|jgi:Fur family transcriptional regulator, peroxide stress response regulator|nr:Fur family transcriptional regulator [Bacillota bacterium]HPE38185.1 Fur family transcriptional regulator [Bacillota bacterium]
MKDSTKQIILSRFKQQNIRTTPQRIAVYGYLLEHRTHPTIDTVYSALKSSNPSLSKTTVYNTVDVLAGYGLILMLPSDTGEIRLDGYTHLHGHFFCSQCHDVYDFECDEPTPSSSLTTFDVAQYSLYATGICPSCKKKNTKRRDL